MTKDFLISPPPLLRCRLPSPFRSVSSDTSKKNFFCRSGEGWGEKETEMTENGDGGGRTPTRVCSLSLSLSTSFPHFRKRSAVLCQFSFFSPPRPRPCYALERRGKEKREEERKESLSKKKNWRRRRMEVSVIDHLAAKSNRVGIRGARRREMSF